MVRWFVWPGSRSCFPASPGTQKLWITPDPTEPDGPEVSETYTGRPTGTWISFAVVTRSDG